MISQKRLRKSALFLVSYLPLFLFFTKFKIEKKNYFYLRYDKYGTQTLNYS